jgi:uncharacterized protein (DUF2235 family)
VARILSLLVWFFGLFLSFAIGAWWLNTIVISLILRRLERFWPLHNGRPLGACFALLAAIWLGFAVLTVIVVKAILHALELTLGDWLSGQLPTYLTGPGQIFVVDLVWVAIGIGILAGLSKALDALAAAKRRGYLLDFSEPEDQDVDRPFPARPGRKIVILCDGTSNRPDERPEGESLATNIWKLSNKLRNDQTQTVWYQAGVGSDSSTTAREARRSQRLLAYTGAAAGTKVAAIWSMFIKLIESGTGVGISEMIVNGYTEIVRQYQPGDRIYLVGFSRGAFAARCIAAVISRCGLLRTEYLRYAPDVVQLYRTRSKPDDEVCLRRDMAYPAIGSKMANGFKHPISIEFIGVFDTVASLGFPLWGWWFRPLPIWRNIAFSTDPAQACRNIYHALAMDERRSQFFPTLFSDPDDTKLQPAVLKQVWFRGDHGDIGGGYARHELSDRPLTWMMAAMIRHGLKFRSNAYKGIEPDDLAPLHDELSLRPTWGMFGTWPRWHPVPGNDADNQASELHGSVIRRAAAIEHATNRPDLRNLSVDDSVEIVVDTRRDWYRTGVIIESGGFYCIEYVGGWVRDAEGPAARPSGQSAKGFDIRYLLGFGKRVPSEKWMMLGATIAHPRAWNPVEKPFKDAVAYLLWSAPKELLSQIAHIGKDLERPGDRVFLTSNAPSGLLYFFANDWWQAAANNSGGPKLGITRVNAPEEGGRLWSLNHGTQTGKDKKPEEVNIWTDSVWEASSRLET